MDFPPLNLLHIEIIVLYVICIEFYFKCAVFMFNFWKKNILNKIFETKLMLT